MSEKPRPHYNELLSKILRTALLSADDTATLAAVAGARRHMQSAGQHPTLLCAFVSGDGSYLDSTKDIVERSIEKRRDAENRADRYMRRLAVLEKAVQDMRRLLRHLPRLDRTDHTLKDAVDYAKYPPETDGEAGG